MLQKEEGSRALKKKLESDGEIGRYDKMQPPRPKVDSNLIDAKLEQLWVFTEPNSTEKFIGCKGVVVIKKGIYFTLNGMKMIFIMLKFQLYKRIMKKIQ